MSTIKTFGSVDDRSLRQLQRCMQAGDAEFGVLCADHHPGYSQPIGGGIAYEGYVSPSGVGYDIGCGNKAARTELTRADLDALGGVEPVMREIIRRISFGMGVPAQERADHPVLDRIRSADFGPQRKLAQLAEAQLGTVGSGNHYVNLMEDEQGNVWVGVHFGSRGFGHKTASGFLALAEGKRFDERPRRRRVPRDHATGRHRPHLRVRPLADDGVPHRGLRPERRARGRCDRPRLPRP
jgi:tRNA-splicing ligase RtcB (3'-phosphate/5'-hydroxy nucleic acid ligase)